VGQGSHAPGVLQVPGHVTGAPLACTLVNAALFGLPTSSSWRQTRSGRVSP
jgi:hypothetical protein